MQAATSTSIEMELPKSMEVKIKPPSAMETWAIGFNAYCPGFQSFFVPVLFSVSLSFPLRIKLLTSCHYI